MAKTLIAMGVVGIALAGALTAQGQTGKHEACDRACLEGFIDKYLDAMIAHDPKLVPLAKNIKFTEDGQKLVLPDGLWNSMAGKGTYRLFVDDPQAGSVAFIGTIQEEGRTPDMPIGSVLALRLKVEKGQISEAETLVVRDAMAAARLEKIGTPNHLFLEAVPEGQRMSRAELVKTANMYFSGMQQNDGKGNYPFTDDCNRIENGMKHQRALEGRPNQTRSGDFDELLGVLGMQGAVSIGPAALRHADSRPPLRSRGSGAWSGVQFRLLRSFGRQDAAFRDAERASHSRGSVAAMDLGDRGNVQGGEWQIAPD